MGRPVELVPLHCLRCSTPLPAQPDEAAWVCQSCGQGQLLDERQGLLPLDVHCSAAVPPNGRGRPFWIVMGQVELSRDTYKGNSARDADKYWSQPRRFCIPAYDCPLDSLLEQGRKLLQAQAGLEEGPPVPFAPVVLPLDDVRAAVEFIIMAVEAERKDRLRSLTFNLELEPPALWVLP